MRGIGNTLAHLLHDQRPFRKQTKYYSDIYSLIFLEDYQGQEDKTSVWDLILPWNTKKPLPHSFSALSPHLSTVTAQAGTCSKGREAHMGKYLRVGMVTAELFHCQGGFEWCPAPQLVTQLTPQLPHTLTGLVYTASSHEAPLISAILLLQRSSSESSL